MPKCPKCKAEISKLIVWTPEYIPSYLEVDSFGALYWSEQNIPDAEIIGSDRLKTKYCCPKCQGVLTTSTDKAIKILTEKEATNANRAGEGTTDSPVVEGRED